MSQGGITNIEKNDPSIPTQFDTESGSAQAASNVIDVVSDTVANATYAEPLFSTASGNDISYNIQVAAARTGAPGDMLDAGIVSFDDSNFTVDANGYVELVGSLGISQIDADSGSAEPSSGVVDIIGGTGITTSAATNVVTIDLDTPVTVSNGGTGRTSHTAYAVLCGGTTTTAAQQSIASVGTSGQLLTSNGAAALPTFQDAPAGGAWTYISTATASDDASVNFTGLSSSYFAYVVLMENVVPATDATEMRIRTSSNNGSSYDSAASDYGYAVLDVTSGTGVSSDQTSSRMEFTIDGIGADTGEELSGELYIINPSAARYTKIYFRSSYINSFSFPCYTAGMGVRNSAADVDAFQFFMESDNIASGTFKLYGITAS